MRQLRLPIPPRLEAAPELAPLAILEVALTACEAALLASYAEIYHGDLHAPRGSSAVRASSIITHARRLSAVIAAYRDALDREERRADRERHRRPF